MRNIFKKLFSKEVKEIKDTHYTSIYTCTIAVWNKCTEDNCIWLRKDINVGSDENDKLAYEMIFNERLREFGTSKQYKIYEKAWEKLDRLRLKFILSLDESTGWRDQKILNKINDQEEIVEELHKKMNENSIDFNTEVAAVSERLGQQINPFTTTIAMYEGFKKLIELKNGK